MALPVTNANDDNKTEESKEPAYDFTVDDRGSHELIIALTAPVGSGASTVAEKFEELLVKDFGYQVHVIGMSDFIKAENDRVSVDLLGDMNAEERFDRFQTAGNELRAIKPSFIVDRAIERINLLRRESGAVLEGNQTPDIPKQARIAYIIDSLKNPAEHRRLRQIYGDLYWSITVFAPEEVRRSRLIEKGVDEDFVKKIMKRDDREDDKLGQHVERTAHLSDYFIRNHSNHKDQLNIALYRFLDTVFGTALITPTLDETGMMKATSAGVGSACLSRQVGAAIYDAEGELIGVGCNDVPKSGGGLYGSDLPPDEDHRCFRWGKKICHNDDRKRRMASKIARELHPDEDDDRANAFETIRASEARNLIEFSRSVHAEMEAIVSVARAGKGSTLGATIYTTTFPCHNCARHIIAAGIDRVVYIEPYAKSLASDLHNDAITLVDEPEKVRFVQYEGFAPKASLRVFSSAGIERKDEAGNYKAGNRAKSQPLFHHPLDSYMTSEELVIRELANI